MYIQKSLSFSLNSQNQGSTHFSVAVNLLAIITSPQVLRELMCATSQTITGALAFTNLPVLFALVLLRTFN
jgi:hypothetical protein